MSLTSVQHDVTCPFHLCYRRTVRQLCLLLARWLSLAASLTQISSRSVKLDGFCGGVPFDMHGVIKKCKHSSFMSLIPCLSDTERSMRC
jgi:hypothetical protein